MKYHSAFSLPLTVLLLAQGISPSWGAPPPNPTASDANYNTAGGTGVLLNNAPSPIPADIGPEANTGTGNTGFGSRALKNNTTGNSNTAIGAFALEANSIGGANTGIGIGALRANTKGTYNTATGNYALGANTQGHSNTATGVEALNNNTMGAYNNAFGLSALAHNIIGNSNNAFGVNALTANESGNSNNAFGEQALHSNTTGNSNTAIGATALHANVRGSNSTAIGGRALYANPDGDNNTAVGQATLSNNTIGSNNLALGFNAGFDLIKGSNNIYLSHQGLAQESFTTRIGSASQTRTFIGGIRGVSPAANDAVAVVIDSNGQLGTLNSSERFKKDIHDMNDASRRLLQLRPVTYHYQQSAANGANPLEYGLIAEEVNQVYPDLVAHNAKGEIETVQYHKLIPMLLNEVQHMNSQLATEKLNNQQQVQEIAALKQQMVVLQAQAQRVEALTLRLSRIEAGQSIGMVEMGAKPGRNPG